MLFLTFILGLQLSVVQGQVQPRIKVNPQDLIGSDVVINTGSRISLTCEGDHPVKWVPRLSKYKIYNKANGNTSSFIVDTATYEFTGTYKCVYTDPKDSNFSSVHVFVRDPEVLFLASSSSRRVTLKEGKDAVLPCLLTDPAATDVQLRMSGGAAPVHNMNITYKPKEGLLIRSVRPEYSGKYVCSASLRGTEKVSPEFTLTVVPKPRDPPYVFLDCQNCVRLIGETLKLTCKTSNPEFKYSISWSHSSSVELPTAKTTTNFKNGMYHIESTLILREVNLNHTGNISCTAANEAGINCKTIHLLVIEEPYLRLSPKVTPNLDHQNQTISVHEGADVELVVMIEAYPPIIVSQWTSFTLFNTTYPEKKLISQNNRYEDRLFLKRLNSKDQGLYSFYANSSKAEASLTFSIYLYKKPEVVMRSANESFISCTAFGNPAPEILWYQCQGTRPTCTENSTTMEAPQLITAQAMETQGEEFGQKQVESVVLIPSSHQKFTLECRASNSLGEDSRAFPIDHSEQLFTATLSGAIAMMVLLLLLLIFLLYKYKQKPKYEVRWKIIEATEGNNYTFIDPTQLPYNEKWEFPRDKLKLGKVLGAGAFGKVVEATAYGLGNEEAATRVAVKMLKASAHSDEKEALMSELKILSHLGQHGNIVNLLGACTHGGPVLVITEYCCHGDLLNFLRNKAETFLNCVVNFPIISEEISDYKNITTKKMFVRSDSGFSNTSADSYLDMKPLAPKSSRNTRASSFGDQNGDSWSLDIDDLLRFALQVSQGLDFLAAKNCIHRDVAARNVLLTDRCVAKICDFGLARDIMNDSNYVVKGNARLPVKWMAPESIFECVYTVQSDVWSYGILLWEIFTLGRSPYPNIVVDSKFYKMIKSGYQMSRPDFASPEMYNIMKMCWNLEPTERPTFSKISQLIKRLLGDEPLQTEYKNLQSEVLDEQELEAFMPTKENEESCEQEEDDQPLIQANNYQFS